MANQIIAKEIENIESLLMMADLTSLTFESLNLDHYESNME